MRGSAKCRSRLHPDGRKSHPPHLKTFRDGWRTLRFFLMCTPALAVPACRDVLDRARALRATPSRCRG